MKREFFFFYGTLRGKDKPTYWGEGILRNYEKHNLGLYPGIVRNLGSEVEGEIHRIPLSDIKNLDRYEGFISEGNPNNLFNREKVIVKMTEPLYGRIIECLVYTYGKELS
mgnify:CR=1 FL=1